MNDKFIPKYIFVMLKRHGNTIVSFDVVKKCGGKESFLEMLKLNGFDCKLELPSLQIVYRGEGVRAKKHYVLKEKGRFA